MLSSGLGKRRIGATTTFLVGQSMILAGLRTFLKNHAKDLVSADFFVVPTMAFQLLFVFVILDHARRRPIHFAVTSNPTAEWTARQLLEAFPWDNAPRYLLRTAYLGDGRPMEFLVGTGVTYWPTAALR